MPTHERKEERQQMIANQLISRGISDQKVLQAMLKVPRHQFVSPSLQHQAYTDNALPIEEGQTISQPYIVALMVQSCHSFPTAKALEIGTGSGYGAAILAETCQSVVTMERLPRLADLAKQRLQELGYSNVTCIVGDGTLGASDFAPYDCILVTAGAPSVPETLKQQLAVGGYLVIPVGKAASQKLLCIHRLTSSDFKEQTVELVRFVPLIGEQGWHSHSSMSEGKNC